ncbi:beta strand repeat-containing protein [Verrucomicrobiota bacterium sgz303538]
MPVPHVSLNQRRLTAAVAALLGLTLASVEGGTFTWVPGTAGAWSAAANWTGGVAPVGNNPADVLIFGGTPPALGSTITDDISGTFFLNSLQFQTTEGSGVLTLAAAAGSSLRFGGSNAQILQNGGGNVTLKVPISSTSNLEFGGTGVSNPTLTTSVVTMDGAISGTFDITKNGKNTFRFGSLSNTAFSGNTWIGTLTVNDGAIRFNNNAYVGPTALRSNPVVLNSSTSTLSTQVTEDSSLRLGTLSGSAGTVSGITGASNSVDIVITALQDGSFGGTISNTGGTNTGKLIVRGTGSQTFTGATQLAKDVVVGRGATVTFAGAATLGTQTTNASIILTGGTFRLDNSQVNNPNRLRDGAVDSTGLDTVGGGTFSLIGNTAGTTEQVARLQLGTSTKPRSGALTINVTQPANATGATVLNIQSYSRDSTQQTYATVNFTSNSTLGVAGVSPRIVFNGTTPTPQVGSGLLNGTNIGANDVGWATVNGSSFATHSTTLGIAPVSTVEFEASSGSTQNVRLGGSAEISTTTNFQRSSVKLEPSAAGQQLSISSSGNLSTGALLLAGDTDFSISNTGTGAGGWTSVSSTRYAYIQSATLSLNVKLVGNGALVKSGAGTLALTNDANVALQAPVAINEGILRATPGKSLPAGEVRFRGGVLELKGDGVNTTTFTRQLGNGANKVTWSGVDTTGVSVDDDRGSGGFAAIGSDATVTITGTTGGSTLSWEDTGFVSSGYALTFGSRSADRMVTWTSNISLSDVTVAGAVQNYNAREFRVIDNSAVTTDRARISGIISGSVRNDLLKSGNGVLELSGNNSFSGATIVQEGTLLVNGTSNSSFLTDVRSGATLGGRGTVGAVRVGAGGTLAPGELAGVTGQTSTFTLGGDLTFGGPGSKLRFELENGSYDKLNVTGGVTLAGADLIGSLLNGFLANQGDLFFLIINDGTDAVQGTFAQGSSVAFDGQMFEISYTGNFENQQFTGGNDVVLRAVPEPSSVLLLGGGLAMLAARRRKRR